MTLIGYWPLNEESGDTAYDYSGNDLHGVATSGHRDKPEIGVPGILNTTSYRFVPASDSGDYVSLPDDNGQYPANDLCISTWVYRASDFDEGRYIFDANVAGSSSNSNDGGLGFYLDSNQKLNVFFHTENSTDQR